jgi:hypothetical protein
MVKHNCFRILLTGSILLGSTLSAQVVSGEWFTGTDPGHGQANAISFTPGENISFAEALSPTLEPGMHTLHLRVKDAEGHWSHTHARYVHVRRNQAGNVLIHGEWFTGTDPGHGLANAISFTPGESISFADALGPILDPGMHTLHLRVKDADGQWSHTQPRYVHVRRSQSGIELAEGEWFTGTDPGFGQGQPITFDPTNELIALPVEATFTGPGELFRWAGLRVRDELGNWGHTRMRQVFVRPEAGGDIVAAEWFIGEDPGFGAANPVDVGTPAPLIENILFEAITQGLDFGDHVLMVRVFNDKGTPSLTYPLPFTIDASAGLDLAQAIGLSIGPNPTMDRVMLRATKAVEGLTVRLLDQRGRLVHEGRFDGSLDLDLSGQAAGTFHLFLLDRDGQRWVFPLVKM